MHKIEYTPLPLLYKEERNVLEEEMRKLDGCDMGIFGTLYSSEKAIGIRGDKWWPQTAEEEGDRMSQ